MDQNPAPPEMSIVQRIMAADDERSARFAMMEIAGQTEARIRMEMTETQAGATPTQGEVPADQSDDMGPAEVDPRHDAHLAAAYQDRPAIIIVGLDAPFEWEGRSVAEIALREPTLGDIEAVLEGRLTQLELFERMSSVPATAFKAMRWTDSERVVSCARVLAPELRRG